MKYHTPVMLMESVKYLQPGIGKKYIDCTLGDGGHTVELLKRGARVLGVDIFPESLSRAQQRIDALGLSANFTGVISNFKNLENIAEKTDFNQVYGILFDLGYSSFQLDEGSTGITFVKDEPLDMRLDKELSVTAADLINSLPQQQLEKIIFEYGGERYAKRITKAIVDAREVKKFQTTKDLADLIVTATPSNYEHCRINPATRTFQAIRIAVNDELENFRLALPQAARVLLPGGRMVIITFHSLEDKIAKEFGKSVQPTIKAVEKKPLVPGDEEINLNPRSRSAKMRIYERI